MYLISSTFLALKLERRKANVCKVEENWNGRIRKLETQSGKREDSRFIGIIINTGTMLVAIPVRLSCVSLFSLRICLLYYEDGGVFLPF